jgi:hypothetical protein
MASYYRKSGGAGDGTGDETDRSINRKMRNMGKSGPEESDREETRDRDGDCSESSDYDLNSKVKGEKKKKASSRYRSRSTKRARDKGTPTGVTPKSKEPRIEVPEARFGAKFDGDGVMIKPSKEREEAIRRVREDKEMRFIANARPHRPSGGERGGGGDLESDDWQVQRGRSNGRGRGRTSERQENNKKHGKNNKNQNLNSGATLGSTAARKSNSFGDSAPIATAAQETNKPRPLARNNSTEQGGATYTAPDNSGLGSNPGKKLMNPFAVPERVAAKSANPNFAAAMANYWARAEEVVYVFSGLTEQLPLSQTHWERILDNIQDQALVLQIKGDPSPEYKYSKFSKLSDKGFLGVASPEQAVLIVQAVSRITIGGVRFRGWREHELMTKHLVTIEIRNELARCKGGVATIVEAMIKRNSLKGETLSAWIENGLTPAYKVFKFFADDILHQELLNRRNGPLGVDQGWNIFLYVGAQHSKAHISQQPGVAAAAEAEVAEIRAERIRNEAATEVSRALKVTADRAATEAAQALTATETKEDKDKEDKEKLVMDHDKDEESEEESDIDITLKDDDEALLEDDSDMPPPTEKNRG